MDSKKLIVGVDYSDEARDALVLARLLAHLLNASAKAVCVVEFPEAMAKALAADTYVPDSPRELAALARRELSGIETEFASVISDSPAAVLYAQAEEEEAAAIVLGSTHRGALGRVHPGSVAASILHGAPCAVAVAPRGYREYSAATRRVDRVGVAVDGSEESTEALASAVELARRSDATLTVVTVIEPLLTPAAPMAWNFSAGQAEEAHRSSMRTVNRRALERVPSSVEHESRVIEGRAGRTISDVSGDFDLLVLGSRGYGPLRRAALGSVAAKVMRSAQCPVMVLPRRVSRETLGLGEPARAAGPQELNRASR
jgi:nucleotide-binding universal stress UspA family protein